MSNIIPFNNAPDFSEYDERIEFYENRISFLKETYKMLCEEIEEACCLPAISHLRFSVVNDEETGGFVSKFLNNEDDPVMCLESYDDEYRYCIYAIYDEDDESMYIAVNKMNDTSRYSLNEKGEWIKDYTINIEVSDDPFIQDALNVLTTMEMEGEKISHSKKWAVINGYAEIIELYRYTANFMQLACGYINNKSKKIQLVLCPKNDDIYGVYVEYTLEDGFQLCLEIPGHEVEIVDSNRDVLTVAGKLYFMINNYYKGDTIIFPLSFNNFFVLSEGELNLTTNSENELTDKEKEIKEKVLEFFDIDEDGE